MGLVERERGGDVEGYIGGNLHQLLTTDGTTPVVNYYSKVIKTCKTPKGMKETADFCEK